MISKKHMILNKIRLDLEKRIEQGETVGYNFASKMSSSLLSCDTKRQRMTPVDNNHDDHCVDAVAVDDIMTPKDHIDPEEFLYQPVVSTEQQQQQSSDTSLLYYSINSAEHVQPQAQEPLQKRRERSTSNASVSDNNNSSSSKNKRSLPRRSNKNSNSGSSAAQLECCVKGCDNIVTNRLRFSLRCLTEKDFKPDFIAQNMNKVCHYHYFADLYKYKKANKANNKGATISNKSARKLSNKRSRAIFERSENVEDMQQYNHQMPARPEIPRLDNPKPLLSTQSNVVTPVSRQDANVFFNFITKNLCSTQVPNQSPALLSDTPFLINLASK
jgi:hypothetical protein